MLPSARPEASGRRGGAYYLDDGPGERDPVELAALAGQPDPTPFPEPLHPRANQPYRVLGNDYRPMTRREPFRQRGVASWYGRKFHGQLTSIGERYDMYGLTAAHPTLPIPSFVRVTHLGNRRSVVLRVNDRGPFLHGRAIDLSYLAAYKLGYAEHGSAEVEVELLEPARSLDVPTGSLQPSLQPAADGAGIPSAVAAGLSVAAPAAAPPAAAPPMAAPPSLVASPAGTSPIGAAVVPIPVAVPAAVTSSVVTTGPAAALPATPAPIMTSRVASTPTPSSPSPSSLAGSSPGTSPMAAPSTVASGPPAASPAASAADGAHFLQLGAFSVRTNAESALADLRRQLDWLRVPIAVEPRGGLFLVQAGPYPVRDLAARAGIEVKARTGLRPLLLPR